MSCRWIKRANLAEYCATCRFGSRGGCTVNTPGVINRDYAYRRGPAEFPKVPA